MLSITIFFLWFLFTARATSVGLDTSQYKIKYANIVNHGVSFSLLNDPGFILLELLVAKFSSSYNVFLGVCGLIIFTPLGLFLYKYCENPFLGLLIFSAGCLQMTFSALRQTLGLAMCLIGLFLFRYENKKPLINYLLLVAFTLIGASFHKSTALFIIAIPFLKVKPKKEFLFVLLTLAILFAFLSPEITEITFIILHSEYSAGWTYINFPELGIIYLFICVFLFLYESDNSFYNSVQKIRLRFLKSSQCENNCENNSLLVKNTSFFPIISAFFIPLFMMLSTSNKILPRLCIFFYPFLIISYSFVLKKENKRNMIFWSSLIIFAFLFIYTFLYQDALGCSNYKFLWK